MKKVIATSLVVFTLLLAGAWYLTAGQLPTNKVGPQPSSQPPQAGLITVQGTIVCLPHKNTSGPQTLECAYGLKDDSGRYFALRDTDPTYQNISSAPMNTRVEVTGEFAPSFNSKYQDVGVIAVSKIETLSTDGSGGGGIGEFSGSIFGTVMLGPSCPVMMNPPDPECADRPYQTSLVVTTVDGARVIKEFQSDKFGRFSVDVPPGEYAIRSAAAANILPYCASNGTIKVKVNDSTEVEISCDTGIR